MKGPEADLIDRVVGIISRYNMFQPGARVGVGLSGGADSVCLLHVLKEIRHFWNLRLTALHLNHRLRGAESDLDERFVRDLSDSWGIPFVCESVDVAALGGNLEQAAREVRRRFFAGQIEAGSIDRVAVAHTRNDQAETVLFRLMRGAYTTGLAGMRPMSEPGIVRPLLEVDRSEVESYLRDRGISWREDSSNLDLRFARNRIRKQLLPHLENEWNPQLIRTLARQATLAQDDEDYWRARVQPIIEQVLQGQSHGPVVVPLVELRNLPPALARRVVRGIVEHIRGDLRQIDFTHLDRIFELTSCSEGHDRTQIPGLDVLRSFDWLRFARPSSGPAERDFEAPLPVPGMVRLPHGANSITAELVEGQTENTHVTLEAELDWDRVLSIASAGAGATNGPLIVRNWRPGDAYQRSGDQRRYKLKELFQEARVPLWERRTWPVVTAGTNIVWTRTFGAAQEFSADSSTRVILRLAERM